ncbi:MAG: alcohol dehydrogenase class IV [Candidatus Endobugula sp.]|jgi:alcohol dehydrogenase class IV
MSAQIILPRIMQVGENASQDVSTVLTSLGCKRPLIITDKMMVELGYVDRIKRFLDVVDVVVDVFDDTVPEPTASSIQAGVNKLRDGDYDSIIALGGGSPIDSAKAISILAKFGGSIQDYKFPRIVHEAGVPIIAIPTTAGTGSEVTRFTIITDEITDEKMLCVGVGFMPMAALVDYSLTLSLPARTTADTGIDALTHAIEAYVSQKSNPYSDSQALSALRLLGPNLRDVYHDGSNKLAREAMMLGSTLAGISFSAASVALVHGMSRPIGAAFHVPHGLSNAMLLPIVTEYSIAGAPERYADCARAMRVADESDSDDKANNKLLIELHKLNKDLQVPTPKEYGIDQQTFFDLIPTMAEQALASGSPNNNPRVPSAEVLADIYKQLW